MQNEFKINRAANPVFFIFSYILIGYLFVKLTNAYWPISTSGDIIFYIAGSTVLLFFVSLLQKQNLLLNIITTLVLLFWGALLAQQANPIAYLSSLQNEGWISQCRSYLFNKIDLFFPHPASNQFSKTLLFGVKSDMHQALKTAYQQLGILHIIAISGMHLDILFKILTKATYWMPDANWARWTKLLVVLMIVWTYTMISNAGPSVVRASLFFSLILIGRFFKMNLFSLNTITTGILIVLFYHSPILSQIGLQLSYAAVLGIHYFYKDIRSLVPIDNTLLKIIWNNLALSIAAQLATLPILLFYFHASSSLSIIGNFLFVPMSSLLLYGLLLFILMPNFFGLNQLLANRISSYIQLMNQGIETLYQFVAVGERSYDIHLVGLIYYYYCLFFLFYWLKKKTSIYFIMLLAGTCVYSSIKLFST